MVSEKTLRKLIVTKKAEINQKQFFTSNAIRAYFVDIVKLLLNRSKRKAPVKVKILWEPKNSSVACTDGSTIHVNAACPFILKNVSSFEDHLDFVKGLVAHELAHMLFTDFDAQAVYFENLERNRFWPSTPKSPVVEDIFDYLNSKKKRDIFAVTVHGIANSIEDGYIENRYVTKYPGNLAQSLFLVREKQCYGATTIEKLQYKITLDEDNPEHILWFTALSTLILQYAKYGIFMTENEDTAYDTELVKRFSTVMPYIDNYLSTASSEVHYEMVTAIVIEFWQYIKEYIEYVLKHPEEENSMNSEMGSMKSEMPTSGKGSGSEADDSDPSEDGESERSKAAKKTSKKAGAKSPKDKSKGDEGKDGSGKSEDKKDKKGKGGSKEDEEKDPSEDSESGASGRDAASDSDSSDSDDSDDSEELTTGKGSSKPEVQTVDGDDDGEHSGTSDDVCDETDASEGGVEKDYDYDGSHYEGAASDVERLLDKIAEEAALESLETDHTKALSDYADSIPMGDMHKGVKFYINRIAAVPDDYIEKYNQIAAPLLAISKAAQRKYIQKIKDNAIGGKATGYYYGKKLNVPSIYKDDGKLFYRNKLPTEKAQLSVCVLVDESGSMCHNDRATYARATAIILEDFCRGLHIPVAIYGHTADQRYSSSGHDVDIYAYADFDKVDNKDRYRLIDICARSNNRDGAALKFCGDIMKKRTEEKKLLIVISDGQPAAYSYGGKSAEEDMQVIKKEITRQGTTVFAAAIGSDKENIRRIYGDGFLDITDLKKLPTILISLISKYLKF